MNPVRPLKWILIALLCLGLLVGQSWITYRVYTARFPGGNDFYSRWANGCALIWTGQNPYSEQVTRQTQIGMYGRPAKIGEDLAAYSYPLYTLFLFWPLCFVHNYALVQAIWMTLMLYTLLAGIVLTARVVKWHPPLWLWGVTLLWGVLNYPHARALILGQMATVVFLGLAMALVMMAQGRDWWAGAVVAVTTIKPQMSFLLIPWLLWWTAWQDRWRVWEGFLATMALLTGLSFVLLPTWLSGFLQDVRNYDVISGTDYTYSLTWSIIQRFLELGPLINGLAVGAFLLWASWTMWRRRHSSWDGFLWTTGLILIVTNFVAPRTATTHYSMLLLPLLGWFAKLSRRLKQQSWLAILSVQACLLLVQWVIFFGTLEGREETALVYLPFPVLMLIVQVLRRASESN